MTAVEVSSSASGRHDGPVITVDEGDRVDQSLLRPYVPRLAVDWLRNCPERTWREIEGSLAFVDISGFTAMSERLARRGKVGAEEVTEVMSTTFARLLEAAYAQGAYLLKFGGDAMFLLFEREEHAERACRAAVEMRQALRAMGRFATSAGSVGLRSVPSAFTADGSRSCSPATRTANSSCWAMP